VKVLSILPFLLLRQWRRRARVRCFFLQPRRQRCCCAASQAANVTYDHRAVVIDGVRPVLVSGSIHYPRSTPDVSQHLSLSPCSGTDTGVWSSAVQMWPGLIHKAKDGGLDVIEAYVFWDIHEPVQG
jgi:hypothetical protein